MINTEQEPQAVTDVNLKNKLNLGKKNERLLKKKGIRCFWFMANTLVLNIRESK